MSPTDNFCNSLSWTRFVTEKNYDSNDDNVSSCHSENAMFSKESIMETTLGHASRECALNKKSASDGETIISDLNVNIEDNNIKKRPSGSRNGVIQACRVLTTLLNETDCENMDAENHGFSDGHNDGSSIFSNSNLSKCYITRTKHLKTGNINRFNVKYKKAYKNRKVEDTNKNLPASFIKKKPMNAFMQFAKMNRSKISRCVVSFICF